MQQDKSILKKVTGIKLGEEKMAPPPELEDAEPHDTIAAFRDKKCDKGHSDWAEKTKTYSIDDHAWFIKCIPCDSYFVFYPRAATGRRDPGLISNAQEARAGKEK